MPDLPVAEAPTRPRPAPTRPATPGPQRPGLVGPFTGRQLLAVGGSVAAAALVLVALTTPVGPPPATPLPRPGAGVVDVAPPTAGLQVGELAPELSGEIDGQTVQLTDLDGQPIRLADLRGRPVWINFWASWCPPCQEETPVLRALHERYRDAGLAIVAVSVQETSPADVREYARTYGLDYTIGFDATSAIFKRYRAFGLPTQFFIDRDGVIRQTWRGPLTESQATAFLAPLVASAEAAPSASAPPQRRHEPAFVASSTGSSRMRKGARSSAADGHPTALPALRVVSATKQRAGVAYQHYQ